MKKINELYKIRFSNKDNEQKNKLWFIPTYMGYGISFYIFPKSLIKYSLSNAYTIWCSLGIILTTIIDYVFYKQIINFNKFIGIVLIITGIKIAK